MRFSNTICGLLAISGRIYGSSPNAECPSSLKTDDLILKQFVLNMKDFAFRDEWNEICLKIDSFNTAQGSENDVQTKRRDLIKSLEIVQARLQVKIHCNGISYSETETVPDCLIGIPFGYMGSALRDQFCAVLATNKMEPDLEAIGRLKTQMNALIYSEIADVGILISLCGTSADIVNLVRAENKNRVLLEYLRFHSELESAEEAVKEKLKGIICSCAADLNWSYTKENEYKARIYFLLKQWPQRMWRGEYEKKCAEVGAFVLWTFRYPRGDVDDEDDKRQIDEALKALFKSDQIAELCYLLGESPGAYFPTTAVSRLVNQATFVNDYAPELSGICSFSSLRDRHAVDLDNAEAVFVKNSGLLSLHRDEIVEICKITSSSKSRLTEAIANFCKGLTTSSGKNLQIADSPDSRPHQGIHWHSQYRMRCAEIEQSVRWDQVYMENEQVTTGAFEAIKTDDQLLALCRLLAQPTPKDENPLREFWHLMEAVRTVNTHASELRRLCPLGVLMRYTLNQLETANNLVQLLSYSEQQTLSMKCHSIVNIVDGIEKLFGIRSVDLDKKKARAPKLSSKCHSPPFTKWGTISVELLDKFEKVAALHLSIEHTSEMCDVLSTYLDERSKKDTAETADGKAINDLKSIVGKYKNAARNPFVALYRGLVGRPA